jgi:hypothetical protein
MSIFYIMSLYVNSVWSSCLFLTGTQLFDIVFMFFVYSSFVRVIVEKEEMPFDNSQIFKATQQSVLHSYFELLIEKLADVFLLILILGQYIRKPIWDIFKRWPSLYSFI